MLRHIILVALVAQGGLADPPGWSDWDSNGNGTLSQSEYDALDDADQLEFVAWVNGALEQHSDDDVRAWVNDHVALSVRDDVLDVPEPGMASQMQEAVEDRVGQELDEAAGAANDLADVAGDAASGAVDTVADSALESVASAIGEGASELAGWISNELARFGRPDLDADWYQTHYLRMVGWASLIMLPLAAFAIGQAVAKGDSARIGQIALQIPTAYLLAISASAIISAATGLSVAMARSFTTGIEGSTNDIATLVAQALTIRPGMGPGAVLVVGLLIALAALATLVWLLLAEAALYAIVLFLPMAFAGRVWEGTAQWGRRLMSYAFALIGARVVIFAVWAVALEGLASATRGDASLRAALALAALLVMMAAAPTVVFRLVHVVEEAGVSPSPGAVARQGLAVAHHGGSVASRAGALRGGGGGGGARLGVTGRIAGAAARGRPQGGGGPGGDPTGRGGGSSGPGGGPGRGPGRGGTGGGSRPGGRPSGQGDGGSRASTEGRSTGQGGSESRGPARTVPTTRRSPRPAQAPPARSAPRRRSSGGRDRR